MTNDSKALAARPEFVQFLAALRGGEGPCPQCGPGEWPTRICKHCSGSGRVAVPPDPHPELVGAAADWWQERGGDLAGMLVAYAGLTEKCKACEGEGRVAPSWGQGDRDCDRCSGSGVLSDDALRPVVLALTERDPDPRVRALAGVARGLGVWKASAAALWWVSWAGPGREQWRGEYVAGAFVDEPAARLALKRAVLTLYDPLVRVPCRAEGVRLAVRHHSALDLELPLRIDAFEPGRRFVPFHFADEYRLDGVRVGAPPDWSWTRHALPCPACEGVGLRDSGAGGYLNAACPDCSGSGFRLLVTWDAAPSSLLPAAEESPAARWPGDEIGGAG